MMEYFRLHLAVGKAFKVSPKIEEAVKECRRIITMFNHSSKKKQSLRLAQVRLELKQHNLLSDCPTRLIHQYKNILNIFSVN